MVRPSSKIALKSLPPHIIVKVIHKIVVRNPIALSKTDYAVKATIDRHFKDYCNALDELKKLEKDMQGFNAIYDCYYEWQGYGNFPAYIEEAIHKEGPEIVERGIRLRGSLPTDFIPKLEEILTMRRCCIRSCDHADDILKVFGKEL